MRLVFKFTESKESEMSEQKRIRISFGGESSVADSREQIVLETPNKAVPTKNVILRTKRAASSSEDDSDWRTKTQSVQERNLIALENSILTDVTLEVGPENTPFQAHKLLLALGSPVFEAMFYGPLAEQGEKIRIPDIMPEGFKVLLRHFYGDDAVLTNEKIAFDAWVAADKYCVPKLKHQCDKYFCNISISPSNVWKLLEIAIFLNSMLLVCRCKKYLEKHTEASLRADTFVDTKIETVKMLLDLSISDVSEIFLLLSVIHWGNHKVNSGKAASLNEAVQPLLPLLRFCALTPAQFCQFLEASNNLLDKSDALAILKHLTEPSKYGVPEWCCKTNWQRECASMPASSSRSDRLSLPNMYVLNERRKHKRHRSVRSRS